MTAESNKLVFNSVDFLVKAPKFRISFSYTDDKGLSFVREFILRLLKIAPCKPKQIADFFDFNKEEILVALDDLISSKYIDYLPSGEVLLTQQGELLFANEFGEPRLNTLHEKSIECCMELIGENFLSNNEIVHNNMFSIEMPVAQEALANCKTIAKRNFQNRFFELKDELFFDVIKGNSENKHSSPELYKINDINQLGMKYYRIRQDFSLNIDTGLQLDRSDVSAKYNEELTLGITNSLTHHKRSQNLKEILKSMEELHDLKTVTILKPEFKFSHIEDLNDREDNLYFVGQIYNQDFIEREVRLFAKKLSTSSDPATSKLLWIGVDDLYWAKQQKIGDLIECLIANSSIKKNGEKIKTYDLRLYLPLEHSKDKHSYNTWQRQFSRSAILDNIYYFKSGLLNNNTEILLLENEFVVICYHTIVKELDATLPIGFFSKNQTTVRAIFDLVQSYLGQKTHDDREKSPTYDFGRIQLRS
ncbi:hypothetical protein [Moraxella oculi]|uniref:Uncharacterized protein n=1 Tax=Moraxella oculi TaxID=2940516 RepID=A0ABW8U7A6_9GAMM